MRILPSRARLAAAGLLVAAVTIALLGLMIISDLDRELELHRSVMVAQQVKDSLDKLRTHLNELRAASRLGAATGDSEAFVEIDRRASEVDTELDYLAKQVSADTPLPTFEALAPAARLLVVHARSISAARSVRGPLSATNLAREAERVEADAIEALERSDAAVTARINDRTLAQIQTAERLRRYVTWLLLGSVGGLTGLFIAYRRVQIRERAAQSRIERLAHFDMLTGLPNRALLIDRLNQESARAKRGARPFAVLMFDLDGFKKVNDTWGHGAGDQVLRQVGTRARACVRASDTVGRLGGDEFLAILPETTLEGAQGVAEKLRAALREPYEVAKETTANVGASVGIAVFPQHGTDAEDLQRAADGALYHSKREGKNRISVARTPRESGAKTAA
ncbi:MAG TPA: GGDEF domain-containing protein [Usitatibacter sp.]|nr:GGDEF domain-containing protein [Usitatibacter sp.]